MGLIAKEGMNIAMIVPLCCYVFICFYAFIGSKPIGPLYSADSASPIRISH
jgi:fucose permease